MTGFPIKLSTRFNLKVIYFLILNLKLLFFYFVGELFNLILYKNFTKAKNKIKEKKKKKF